MIGSIEAQLTERTEVRPEPGDCHQLVDHGQGRARLVQDRQAASRTRHGGEPSHDERDRAAIEELTRLLPQRAAGR
jgi:hypothetical protein